MVNQRIRREAASNPGAAGTAFVSNGSYGAWVGGSRTPLESFAPSQSDDWTDAISAAITAAGDGGTIEAHAGVIPFAGEIVFPEYVNLWGSGDGHTGASTTFLAFDAGARISFGERGVGSYGGFSGNFRIDADDVATTPLYLGRTLGRHLQNITVYDTAAGGTGLLVEEAQNWSSMNLKFFNLGGDGITFDRGAAGANLYATEVHTCAGWMAHFKGTAIPSGYAIAHAQNTHFWGGILEHSPTGIVYTTGGRENHFYGMQMISDDGAPVVKMENADLGTANTLGLHSYTVLGGDTLTGTAFDLDDAAVVEVTGKLQINNLQYAYLLRDSQSRVEFYGGAAEYASGVTVLDPASVGSFSTAIVGYNGHRLYRFMQAAADTVEYVAVVGDAAARYQRNANGSDQWGSGSAAVDTVFGRRAANTAGTNDDDILMAGAGTWNGGHLRMGNFHFWVDGSSNFRGSIGVPSSDTDGAIIGTLT